MNDPLDSDLKDRLDSLGTHLDGERQRRRATADDTREPAAGRRSGRILLVAAVAVILVGMAALVAQNNSTAEQIEAVDQTPTPRVTANGDVSDRTIFPAGGRVAADEAAFASAEELAQEYLDSRLDAAPEGIELTGTIRDAIDIPGVATIVTFSIQTPDDSGDGYIYITPDESGTDSLAVIAAAIIGVDLTDLSLVDGVLQGSISTSGPGERVIEVRDARTDELIDATTVDDDQLVPVRFAVDGIDAEAVNIRVWVTTPRGGVAPAHFAEVHLADGDTATNAGWTPMSDIVQAHFGTSTSATTEAITPTTFVPGDCRVNVRFYNSAGRAGIATRATDDLTAFLENTDIVNVLSPKNGPAWDGAVAWLLGPDSSCLDPTLLGLPEPDLINVGDLDDQWSELGVEPDTDLAADDTSNTIVVVLGSRYTG